MRRQARTRGLLIAGIVAIGGFDALAGSRAVEASLGLNAHADAFLSSPTTPDQLTASLQGSSCEHASFQFSIERNGVTLFRRSVPMNDILRCDWVRQNPGAAQWAAVHVLNEAVSVARAVNRGCMEPDHGGCWTSPSFKRLRDADAPVLCFSTGYESSSCVAYDPESKSIVEVRRYSE